jgi:hypothetical protein
VITINFFNSHHLLFSSYLRFNLVEMNSISARIQAVKEWLLENLNESKIVAAKLHQLLYITFCNFIKRTEKGLQQRDEHNKILEDHEIKALHAFIRSLLAYNIQSTKRVVFNAVRHVKRLQTSDFEDPTKRWFSSWWQANRLHTIKTKPLTTVRYSAAQATDVREWFEKYRRTLKELNIQKRRNILNFDEAGFRVECMKEQDIIMPDDVREYYVISLENRRSLTIFETINAADDFSSPPLIIIQGQKLMSSWFDEELPDETRIISSEKSFISDKIAMTYLQHLIEHLNAVVTALEWKLLLMNNHGSHVILEFFILTNDHHIRPFSLIAHLTHCMQPLDVSVFQPYKHWHDNAIQEAIAKFNVKYFMSQFCADLFKIRGDIFKKSTIRSAFAKSGMWPIKEEVCLDQLRKFFDKDVYKSRKISELFLSESSLPRVQSKTLHDVQAGFAQWLPKIQNHTQWSDPIREKELNQFMNCTKEVVAESSFNDFELSLHHKRRNDELTHKLISRRRLKPNWYAGSNVRLTKQDALRAIAEKKVKENETKKKKSHNQFMKIWRMERDTQHKLRLLARKMKKARLKRVKEFRKQGQGHLLSTENLTIIEDPEAVWKATDPIWKEEEVRKQQLKMKSKISMKKNEEDGDEGDGDERDEDEQEDEDIIFIEDTVGDRNLASFLKKDIEKFTNSIEGQLDYVPFDSEDDVQQQLEDNLGDDLGDDLEDDVQQQLRDDDLDDDLEDNSEDDVQEHLGFYWLNGAANEG